MDNSKITEKTKPATTGDDSETIDADQLLAVNQEAAKKQKAAREALLHKKEAEDEESGLEFEATTIVKNVSELLGQTSDPTLTGQSTIANNPQARENDSAFLQKAQELEKKIVALLAPFSKSKNPKVVAQVNKIKKLLAQHSGSDS